MQFILMFYLHFDKLNNTPKNLAAFFLTATAKKKNGKINKRVSRVELMKTLE